MIASLMLSLTKNSYHVMSAVHTVYNITTPGLLTVANVRVSIGSVLAEDGKAVNIKSSTAQKIMIPFFIVLSPHVLMSPVNSM